MACQALSITAAQAGRLPRTLNGTTVLLRDPGAAGLATLLEDLRARGARIGVHLTSPRRVLEEPAYTAAPAAASNAFQGPADDIALIVLDAAASEDVDRLLFELKQALTAARGRWRGARLIVAADTAVTAALRDRGLAPYLDAFAPPPMPMRAADDLLTPINESFVVRMLPSTEAAAGAIAVAAADLQSWFPEGLVPVPGRALSCRAPISTWLNPRTLDLVGVSNTCPLPATVTSDVSGAFIERYDLASTSAFLVHAGSSDRFAEGVDVAASRALTAEEIVARHQAAAARQAAAIATDIASGTMTLTFEAPGFIAPVTVSSETTLYQAPADTAARAEIRQHNIRVNGVPFNANGGVPRLPIIEPERAAAPPLAITLSNLYRYRLAGRERVRGHDSYVLAFEPRSAGESLYAGRVWIDAASFGMVRVAAAQTQLKGPITASEQADDFEPDAAGRWLLVRSDVRQTYEGASVRTPIHRLMVLQGHDINRTDFVARRSEAHASADVMLRDTPAGFRYLAREGTNGGFADQGSKEGTKEGSADQGTKELRVVAGRADRIRTLAFGVIVDPNISIPLPFAGLSYVDFNLFGTGTQFSGFFGGSYAQLAFAAPSVRGTRWQLAGRAFGIASSYNDRAFAEGREQYPLDIRQRPAQAAVWLLRPLSARTALRLEYDWDYNRFGRTEVSAPAFVIPRNQNAHGIRLGLEAQRAGWQGSLWGSYTRRIGWRPWGIATASEYSPAHADFQRAGVSLSRAQAVTPRLTTRIEGAVMSGRDLDRFSRYAFGTFDNRLHGYPAALIRYDRGAVIRTAAAWSLGAVRLDGFADSAAVHDPGFGHGLRHYSGIGTALEAPGPFRTLLSLEWGYGFQGINTNGRQGTHVVRLSGYKVF